MMRKFIFTLMLAIAGGVWTMSEAICIVSLCDEWHILEPGFSWPYTDKTYMHRLANDTLINGQLYVQLESNETGSFVYEGAMRESDSKIYYIHSGSTHEYLLYDFNVQVGDTLTNIWIGGLESEYCQISSVKVDRIEGIAPSRNFVLTYLYQGEYQLYLLWIEGVGMNYGPAGWGAFPGEPVDPTPELLCAYKDGKRVYATSEAEQYNCCYNAQKINSLCDTWNVLEVSNATCSNCEEFHTVNYQLTTDTMINQQLYVRIEGDHIYKGAMREDVYGDIYYIPAGSAHEYLLYSFRAQEGQTLTNLWLGGSPQDAPNGWTIKVEEIHNTNPRTFVLSTGFTNTEDSIENYPLYIEWIEGVGQFNGPIGSLYCVGCANSRAEAILCAYKNGEQIYASDLSEQYGCVYNYDPFAPPADTIPLYVQDDPGSSTVDPVDPNQVVATLQGDLLIIHENIGMDITYSLRHNAPAEMPSKNKAPQTQTFRNEVTVQITESGAYLLQLTNPSWGYSIVGRFNYIAEGIDSVNSSSLQGGDRGRLIIHNGQLLIRRGEKIYTITGQQIQ